MVLAAVGIGSFIYFSDASGAPTSIESIAVMPFVNESGNPNTEYISDGVTETLIGHLSKLSELRVKASSTVFRFKGEDFDAQTVGRELSVQSVLIGRVFQRGDDLSLYLSHVDTRTGNQIWGIQ